MHYTITLPLFLPVTIQRQMYFLQNMSYNFNHAVCHFFWFQTKIKQMFSPYACISEKEIKLCTNQLLFPSWLLIVHILNCISLTWI